MHISVSEHPSTARRWILGVALVALTLLGAACGSDTESDGDDGGDDEPTVDLDAVLGTPSPATGEPVLLGFVSDGRGAAIDNSPQFDAADGVVEYINEYRGGIAGRPIELVDCETRFEPGRATDCANELVQKGVAAVIMPESSAALGLYGVLKEERIPIFSYGVGDTELLLDTELVFNLADTMSGLSDVPIAIAKDEGLDKVTAVVVDVPAATTFYKTLAVDLFADAGIELELVAVPADQADMTPQMTQVANGDPSVVQIVGHDAFCIAAINGLYAADFDGPISMLALSCGTEAVTTGLGEKLDGVNISSASAQNDPDEPGIALWRAILQKYDVDIDENKGLTTFVTFIAFMDGLEGLEGDITPESITSALKSMPQVPLVAGGGINQRCNGQASDLLPALCTVGNLRATLDADGEVVLPWTPVGAAEIPG